MVRAVALGSLIAALAGVGSIGCTQAVDAPVAEGDTGTIQVPLVSETDGTYYYLHAQFEIEQVGAEGGGSYDKWVVSTEDFPEGADSLNWPVNPGLYEVRLLDAWNIEVGLEDGTRKPINAILASPKAQQVRVTKAATSEVHFDFLRRLDDGDISIGFSFHKTMAFDGLFTEKLSDGSMKPAYDFQMYFDCTMETSIDEKNGLMVRTWNYGPTAVEWKDESHDVLAGLNGSFTVGIPRGSEPGSTVSGKFSGIKLAGKGFDVFHGMENVEETWSWTKTGKAKSVVDEMGFPSLDGLTIQTSSKRTLKGLESGNYEEHVGTVDMYLTTVQGYEGPNGGGYGDMPGGM